MIYNIFIANRLALEDGADTNIKAVVAANQLVLEQSIAQSISDRVVADLLTLSQTVRVSKSISLSASNLLTMIQETYPRVRFLDVVSYMLLIHEVRKELPILANSLVLSQLLAVDKVKPARSSLTLQQSLGLSATKTLEASNVLTMDQDVNAYKPSEYFIQ